MIQHVPYGIDDPYKRQPVERFPRDPEEGEEIQVSFACPGAVSEAWAVLEAAGQTTTRAGTSLGGGLWVVWFPPLAAGTYRYRLYARDGNGVAEVGPFELPVARWRAPSDIAHVDTYDQGAILRWNVAADGPFDARSGSCVLCVPAPGILTVDAHIGGEAPAPSGLPCRFSEADGVVRIDGVGVTASVDVRALAVEVCREGQSERVATLVLSHGWLERPDGTVQAIRSGLVPFREGELYGLGERFVGPDLRGRVWDTRVYEEYKEQGQRTYMPVPLLVSPQGWGVFFETAAPARFDLERSPYEVTVETGNAAARLVHHVIVAEEPYDVTHAFTRLTGDIAPAPSWVYGPWMSANTWNSQAKAELALRRTLAEDVPATVLVLEAWSDETTFYIFNDAEYAPHPGRDAPRLADFSFHGRWPDPKRLIDECHDNGVRVLLWQIPVQKKLDAPHAQHDADEAHMLECGYAIRKEDGTPYRNRGWWFDDALVLDVTNPDACAWWFDKRRYLFEELGIDGMKTDGGEHIWGRGLAAHDGSRGTELVNTFAQRYVDAYHSFVRDATGGDGITFSRAGYTGAQRSPAHWAGDENSTWNGYRASILAGLSAGIAGVSLWGFDIGGFSGDVPTVELYVRATQVACFSPIMQFHSELHKAVENRDRTPWNIAERHADGRALDVYRAYAKLRMRLIPYVASEAEALAGVGRPLMRMPALDFPHDHDRLCKDPYAYMFGRDLLVCPVLEKGALAREVLLPAGQWVDLWSGARLEGARAMLVPSPLERIPVFVRAASPRLDMLLDAASEFTV